MTNELLETMHKIDSIPKDVEVVWAVPIIEGENWHVLQVDELRALVAAYRKLFLETHVLNQHQEIY